MVDLYASKRARVAHKLKLWRTGDVTLTRSTPGEPDPATPWTPGEATVEVFVLDARVDGVAAEYINETTILASDLMVIVSPKARNSDDVVVDIVPLMTDALHIDGAAKVIKKIDAIPAAGLAARFHVFVAS